MFEEEDEILNELYYKSSALESEIREAESDRDDMIYQLEDLRFMRRECIDSVREEWDDHIDSLRWDLRRMRNEISEREDRRYAGGHSFAYCG